MAQQSRVGAMADLERARLQPGPTPDFSFGEQLGAAFRTENLFATHVAPLFGTNPEFEDDPEFDAEPFLGAYAKYTQLFPELKTAGSLGELASIKNRIDGELRDREILEGMGFGRSLAVYLPAGLLSPENFIPIGAAARAAGIGVKAGAKSIGRTALGVGASGVVTQGVAELALLQKQRFRTEQEAIINTIGAGLFSSLLGGGAAGVGKAGVLGREVVTDVVDRTNKHIGDQLADPNSKLGRALDNAYDRDRGLTRPGGSDVLPKAVDDSFYGDTLSLDASDPLRGAFLAAVEEVSPRTAKLLGADSRIANMAMKLAFLNPSQRTARSQNPVSRLISESLDKQFLTQDGAQGPSAQALINLNEAILMRKRMLANSVWQNNEKAFKLADVAEEEFLEMAGKAARRGGVNDDPSFAKIRENPALAAAVEERAAKYHEITETMRRTSEATGALSRQDLTPTKSESILNMLDGDYVARVIDQDRSRLQMDQFREDMVRGLEARREVVLPEFIKERAELARQAAATDNPAHKKFLEDQVADLDDWIGKLNQDEFRTTSRSIVDNYLSRSPSTGEVSSFQSSLMQRVLKIDERFLEPYLISNVAELEERLVRSVLPDLTLSDFFQRGGDPRGRMGLLQERADQSRKTVQSVVENGTASPELAEKIVRDLQDLADDAQGVLLGHSLRLSRNLDEIGIENIAKTMDEIDEALEIRSKARRKMQDLDLEKKSLKNRIAARRYAGADVEDLVGRMERIADDKALARAEFDGATGPINEIATKLGRQIGNTSGSMGRKPSGLLLQENRFSLPGATNAEEAGDQLMALARAVHANVAGARRYVYRLNLDAEHLEAAIRRESEKMAKTSLFQRPGKGTQLINRTDRDVADIRAMHDRLRNKHWQGAVSDSTALASKRLRDFNFTTKMGSVVISSLPDMVMAVSTAGMKNYAAATARFVKNELFASDAEKRTYGQELQRAIERFSIAKRHDKLFMLDDDIYTKTRSRAGKVADQVTDTFAKATMMDRWNAMQKMIASQAIESRMAKTVLSANPSKVDREMLRWFGIADADVPRLQKMLSQHSIDEGGLRLSNVEDWSDRNLRLKWEAALMQGVNATIITPSAGDLPRFATHPLGKVLLQFRTFSFAATNKFLLPGLQRSFALGDPGPALTFAMASGVGLFVHSLNETLKGRDPTEQKPQDLIYNAIDRAGTLGILTEATSTGLRALNGLGIDSLGAGPSRFRSRNITDSLLGPSVGTAQSALEISGMPFKDDFRSGDASTIRRMIPFQNLWLTRILLDGGLNTPSAGQGRYFDDHLKFEHRLTGFDAEEVP